MGRGLFSCLMFVIWYYVIGKLLWYRVVSFACSLWNILFYIIWCSVSSKKGQLFGMENLVHIHRVPCSPLISKNIHKKKTFQKYLYFEQRGNRERDETNTPFNTGHDHTSPITFFTVTFHSSWTVHLKFELYRPSRIFSIPHGA